MWRRARQRRRWTRVRRCRTLGRWRRHEGGGGGTTAAEVLELELDLIRYAREAPRVNTHWTSWPTRQYATVMPHTSVSNG